MTPDIKDVLYDTGARVPVSGFCVQLGGREITAILQNAETIRLTRAGGEAVSLVCGTGQRCLGSDRVFSFRPRLRTCA